MAETKHIVTAWAHCGLFAWFFGASLAVLLIGLLYPLPSYAVINDRIVHSSTDPSVVTVAAKMSTTATDLVSELSPSTHLELPSPPSQPQRELPSPPSQPQLELPMPTPWPQLEPNNNSSCVNSTNTTTVYITVTDVIYRVRESSTVLFYISPTLLVALAGFTVSFSELRQFFLLYTTKEEPIPKRESALLTAIYTRSTLMIPCQMLFTWALLPVTVIASVEAQLLALAVSFVVYYSLAALEGIMAIPTATELNDMLNLFEPTGDDVGSKRAVRGCRKFITIWFALYVGLTTALLFGVSRTSSGVSTESWSFAAVAFAFYEAWTIGLFVLPFAQYYGLASHKEKNKSYPELDYRVDSLYYWEWGHMFLTWICASFAGGFIAGAAKQ